MTDTASKSLGDQVAAMVALIDGWQAGHEKAEREALAQLATAVSQVKALERAMRARHARYPKRERTLADMKETGT